MNAFTKLTPFEIDTGRKVPDLISHEYRYSEVRDLQLISEFASNFSIDREELVRKAYENLEQAQAMQKKHYDVKE